MQDQLKMNEQPVVLFDGVCNLCNASVQSIIKKDRDQSFRFASLQSKTGMEILQKYGEELKNIDSIILLHRGSVFIKSNAILQIFKILGGLALVLYTLRIIPRPLRDRFYDWIAANRYSWFGKRDVCMVPGPELESRFLP